jgi:hypothetical protein
MTTKSADSHLMVLTELIMRFSGACGVYYGWRYDDLTSNERHGVQGRHARDLVNEFAKLLSFGTHFDNAGTKAAIKRYLADKPDYFRDEVARIINFQRQHHRE